MDVARLWRVFSQRTDAKFNFSLHLHLLHPLHLHLYHLHQLHHITNIIYISYIPNYMRCISFIIYINFIYISKASTSTYSVRRGNKYIMYKFNQLHLHHIQFLHRSCSQKFLQELTSRWSSCICKLLPNSYFSSSSKFFLKAAGAVIWQWKTGLRNMTFFRDVTGVISPTGVVTQELLHRSWLLGDLIASELIWDSHQNVPKTWLGWRSTQQTERTVIDEYQWERGILDDKLNRLYKSGLISLIKRSQ